jgi:DNA-binding transcriptional LysR family regulator
VAKRRAAYKELRVAHLRSLVVCARTRNLSAAAVELGLSRPALWQQLKTMEAEFAADFFQRRRHGVELTEDGRLFLELAEPLLAGFNGLKQAFDERRGRRPRLLKVACSDSIQQAEMVGVVNEFRKRRPEVSLTFVESWSALVPGLLVSGDVQLGIEGMPPEPRDARLEYTPLFSRDIYVAVPKAHPLASRRKLTLPDLLEHPFVMEPPVSRLRKHVSEVIERAGLADRWQIALDTPSERFLLEAVAGGLAISVITRSDRRSPHDGVRLLPAADLFGRFEVFLVRRKRVTESDHERAFREALQSAFRDG